MGVMASYSEFEGVPIHASRAVLTELLRGRMGFTGTVVSDYNGVGWAQTRQLVAPTPEDIGALALAAGMDVELPGVHGYGPVLVQAVKNGKVTEAQLNESVRRILRDKIVLGLFENPYVKEDPVVIQKVATEGVDLSRRLAAESVTLLKNENNLLPLSRDVKKVAVIGPHADAVMVGFPQYTYPAALPMLRVAVKIGAFPMPGVGTVPPEGMGGLESELASAHADVEQYARTEYAAVSLADAVRKLLPNAEVNAVAGTGVLPSQPTDIPAAVAAAKEADAVILYIGGKGGWYGDDLTEKLESDTVDVSGEVRLALVVTNTGKRRGTEIVQLYAADSATGVTLPAQQLIGFARVDLDPGASKTVSFLVPMSLLAYTGLSGDVIMEPGPVEFSAGSSSSDIRSSAKFTVIGRTRVFKGEDRAFLSVAKV
jgi:beta-glucosidase